MVKKTLKNIKMTTAKELLDRDFAPRHMIIDPWLRTEETGVIWAASGVGKTMLSLSLAIAVAGGGSVSDWACPNARKVIYIDGEMNQQDIRDRIKHLISSGAVMLSDPTLALENLTIVARQAQDVGTPFYDLTMPESQDELLRIAKVGSGGLLILDNFTTLTDSLDDENDATQFKKVQDFFLQMKRLGIATILVHHANKGGKQMRGSTALETTFEVIVGLRKPALATTGEARFVVEFSKFRGKADKRLEPKDWTLKDNGWEVVQAEPEDAGSDQVLVALKSLDFVSQVEIGARVGMDKSSVCRRIQKAEALGFLKAGEADKLFKQAKTLRASILAEGDDESF